MGQAGCESGCGFLGLPRDQCTVIERHGVGAEVERDGEHILLASHRRHDVSGVLRGVDVARRDEKRATGYVRIGQGLQRVYRVARLIDAVGKAAGSFVAQIVRNDDVSNIAVHHIAVHAVLKRDTASVRTLEVRRRVPHLNHAPKSQVAQHIL